jgi:hypothetical protein
MVAGAGMKLTVLMCLWHPWLQRVSCVVVAGAGIKLTALVCLWHPWLDRR